MNTHTILFYRVNDEYGEFSNFARYPIHIDGKVWPTSEHYYQAQKFAGTENEEVIRKAKNAWTVARLGNKIAPLPGDWEVRRIVVMYEAVRAKFTQHPELRLLLLATGDAILVEHTRNDAFWGDGGDGSGQNQLGKILMDVRDELAGTDYDFSIPRTEKRTK